MSKLTLVQLFMSERKEQSEGCLGACRAGFIKGALLICVLSLVVLFLPEYAVTALSPVAVMTLEEWGNVLIQ